MIAGIDFRPISKDDLGPFMAAFGVSFGWTPSESDQAEWDAWMEYDRTLAAFEGDRIVATSGVFSFELALPGSTTAPAGGVTLISVLPTHRRRGILSEFMRRELADARERDEPLGMLLASESIIYGRFGYGLAISQATYEIERSHGTLRRPTHMPGNVEILDKGRAAAALPDVYERLWRRQPGFIKRDQKWWDMWLKDPERDRRGASGRFYAIYREGDVQGYLAYRVKSDWQQGIARNELRVEDFMTLTPNAYEALWTFCMRADLVGTVVLDDRPIDEVARWMLADPRRLRVRNIGDHIWIRLVDVASALAARRYLTEGSIVLSVHDPFCPENTGVYRLEGEPEGAVCRRSDAEPDLVLGVDDLGATYLGGVTFCTLARAGRVEERVPGALRRADALFATERAPWCANEF